MSVDPNSKFDRALRAIERLGDFASPAALRNIRPIMQTLDPYLPTQGQILEIAAGSGFHSAVLAAQFTDLTWQPSEADPRAVEYTRTLVDQAELENLKPPILLDVETGDWPLENAGAILCCNMIHISPWSAAEGLFSGAGQLLETGSPLFLYGPFLVEGQHTAPSNAAFDQNLRSQNPDWGVRDSMDVDALAVQNGLRPERTIEMPANNMIRIYRRQG